MTSLLPIMLAALAIPSAATPLTPDGWGDLRIGMTEAAAAQRFGLAVLSDDDDDSPACRQLARPDWPGVLVMVEDGRVTRISAYEPPLRTDTALAVGSTEAEVRRAYGRGLKVEPHFYAGDPALYLTAWDAGRKRGVRYETDTHRRVSAIHVGSAAIRYVEGCL